jgi:hypothetical protein
MSRELENSVKRAKNMLEYYNEKLIKDETKLKSAKSSKIFSLIETIILFIINSMFFILVTYALATGNILPSLISISIYAGTLDRLVKTSNEYKKLNEDYLNIRNTVIQDSSYIKTYEEELNKAISKLNELENENVLESNVTLNSGENLSKPLVRKRILK